MEVGEQNAAWLSHPAWSREESGEVPGSRDQQGLYVADIESLIRQRATGEPLKKGSIRSGLWKEHRGCHGENSLEEGQTGGGEAS